MQWNYMNNHVIQSKLTLIQGTQGIFRSKQYEIGFHVKVHLLQTCLSSFNLIIKFASLGLGRVR